MYGRMIVSVSMICPGSICASGMGVIFRNSRSGWHGGKDKLAHTKYAFRATFCVLV
jgi:hypothetical protein